MIPLFYRNLYKALHGLLDGLVGGLVKSPLEEDYGEARPEGIRATEAAFTVALGAVHLADILEAFSRKSCGEIRQAQITRAVRRLAELPLGRQAILHLSFSRTDADDDEGALIVEIHKHAPKACNVCFRGSETAIEAIRRIDAIRAEFDR